MKRLLSIIALLIISLGAMSTQVTLVANNGNAMYYPDLRSTVNPGDTINLTAGTYDYIVLGYVQGTLANPIYIRNFGGVVTAIGSNGFCMRIIRSKFFRITGSGSGSYTYGLRMQGQGISFPGGLTTEDSITNYRVDHVEAFHVENGFSCNRVPENGKPWTWAGNWYIRMAQWDSCYVHNCRGEAFYLGNTASYYIVKNVSNVDTAVEGVHLRGTVVKYCRTDSSGWDGIQLASSDSASYIYGNTVLRFGTRNEGGQQAGILFGGKCKGEVYNNFIKGGTGNGVEVFGFGLVRVYNNIVVNTGLDGGTGQDAIIADDRPAGINDLPVYIGLQVYIVNNTVVKSGRNSIRLYNSFGTMLSNNKVINNLLIAPVFTSPGDKYIQNGSASVQATSNLKILTADLAYFIDTSASNFHILTTSPAKDAGQDGTPYGVTADYDGNSRPQGLTYDVGAFEFIQTISVSTYCFVSPADLPATIRFNETNKSGR